MLTIGDIKCERYSWDASRTSFKCILLSIVVENLKDTLVKTPDIIVEEHGETFNFPRFRFVDFRSVGPSVYMEGTYGN